VPVTSDYFSQEYFAHRPASERLINKKLNLRGLNKMQSWEDALQEYLRDYYEDYLG
jgi:dTDP-4-dehydrorhamnose reductase